MSYNIAWYLAPKEIAKFKKWHTLACPGDPLSAEERFVKEGGVLPKKKNEHK